MLARANAQQRSDQVLKFSRLQLLAKCASHERLRVSVDVLFKTTLVLECTKIDSAKKEKNNIILLRPETSRHIILCCLCYHIS